MAWPDAWSAGCGWTGPARARARRIRHPQGGLPIGPRREHHREHRGNRIARARDVAYLDRMSRNMNGVALARHQRHAVLALRHQHGLAIGFARLLARERALNLRFDLLDGRLIDAE